MTTGASSPLLAPITEQHRDLRLDLIRGIAILIIFSDHVLGNPVRDFMPISLGFSDMAEVFVFLSGYLNATNLLSAKRPPVVRRHVDRSVNRCLRIYAAILLMHLLAVGLLAVCHDLGFRRINLVDLMLPQARDQPDLWSIVTLQRLLFSSSVLALYLVLIGIAPLVAALLRRRPAVTIAASVALYASVQVWPRTVSLPQPWADAVFFNPFAWQLPFVLGMAYCLGRQRGWNPIPQSLPALVAAACGLELAFLVRIGWLEGRFVPEISKMVLDPARLAHFGCVLIVGRAMLAGVVPFLKSPVLRPVIRCGQHSLVTYLTGGVMATLGSILIAGHPGNPGWVVMINMAGWTACMLVASVSATLSRRAVL